MNTNANPIVIDDDTDEDPIDDEGGKNRKFSEPQNVTPPLVMSFDDKTDFDDMYEPEDSSSVDRNAAQPPRPAPAPQAHALTMAPTPSTQLVVVLPAPGPSAVTSILPCTPAAMGATSSPTTQVDGLHKHSTRTAWPTRKVKLCSC